ncbi:hypothetical protein ACRALDRAFT_2060082 [Sodiomyces alcalophilus JCM 7366]|uniref:uncharacterized protein n=1 Tax=Sodiomyces alcalophilus JCM 7366 TaxID=591952 RepID=UPI0039B4FBEB
MEQDDPFSHIAHPASIYKVYKHRREYPALPEGYDWETQKQLYCPRDLLIKSTPGPLELKHKFGYVFCHRGLYERASGILDNTAAAISNGIRQDLFLHEVDVFVLGKLDEAFLAHDKNPRRVTAKTEPWGLYSFHEILKTALVTRRVETETKFVVPKTEHLKPSSSRQGLDTAPTTTVVQKPLDFASSYLESPEHVLGLLDALWNEKLAPVGRTVQIDFRDEDFAKAIPHCCFHVSKQPFQYRSARGAHNTLAWALFQSTILKGYSKHYKSFDHLHAAIKKESIAAYGRNYFQVRHLHVLPPLVMVFFPKDVVALADETSPRDARCRDRRTYEHIRHTFMNQVLSFVGVGENSYNFILEIVHSGLGLGYDVKTNTAKNPLDWKPLTNKDVIFDSLVDRAMIDVSLELREKYPELLFSSCTRLPDVITPEGKFKAGYETSRLESWKDGEEGLAAKLRAMHGGLYPQSHLVVADDPAAEIAARTWIDQKSGLDRSDLLTMPYNKWLQGAREVQPAMEELNAQDFLPNKFGEPTIPADDTLGALHAIDKELDRPIDSGANTRSWVETLETTRYPTDPSGSTDGVDKFSSGKQGGHDNTVDVDYDLPHAADEPDWKDDARSQSGDVREGPLALTIAGRHFVFRTKRELKHAAAYVAAAKGDTEALGKLLFGGANANVPTGPYGTPLAIACANGHRDCAELLLDAGANVNGGGDLGSPLELASGNGHSDIVEMLLAVLIKNNAYDGHDALGRLFTGTALHRASLKGDETVVRLLLERGADVELTHPVTHDTALHMACIVGKVNIVNMLLDSNADINARGSGGTALRTACHSGHPDVAKRLLEHGAVIDFSTEKLKPEIVSLLIDAGANVDRPAATQPSSDTAGHLLRPKFWKKIEANRKRLHNRAKNELKKEIKSMEKPPLKEPRRLPNCGCLICYIDQSIQPAIPRYVKRRRFISTTDPVSLTLGLMKIGSADS